MIALRIKGADLRRYVRLESAVPENQKEQGWKEHTFEAHEKMADGHEHRAHDNGPPLPQDPVGQQPTEERREIDKPRIQAVDLRRVLLGEQKVPDHVVYEKRPHTVIREPLPHFCEEKKVQSLGMTVLHASQSTPPHQFSL